MYKPNTRHQKQYYDSVSYSKTRLYREHHHNFSKFCSSFPLTNQLLSVLYFRNNFLPQRSFITDNFIPSYSTPFQSAIPLILTLTFLHMFLTTSFFIYFTFPTTVDLRSLVLTLHPELEPWTLRIISSLILTLRDISNLILSLMVNPNLILSFMVNPNSILTPWRQTSNHGEHLSTIGGGDFLWSRAIHFLLSPIFGCRQKGNLWNSTHRCKLWWSSAETPTSDAFARRPKKVNNSQPSSKPSIYNISVFIVASMLSVGNRPLCRLLMFKSRGW